MAENEDSDADAVGRKSPVVEPPDEVKDEKPRLPPRTFMRNPDYLPSLMEFGLLASFVYGMQWMTERYAILGYLGAVLALIFMFEWERRARFTFGRMRPRAHFDALNLVKLPKQFVPRDIELEPPTPYTPAEEKIRTDPATIVRQAQDTLSGGSRSSDERQSPMEATLINLLIAYIEAEKALLTPRQTDTATSDGNGPQPGSDQPQAP